MASVFGLPLDKLYNLSDTRDIISEGQQYKDKFVFVGGKYDEKHSDVFSLFGYSVTDNSKHEALALTIAQLFTVVPVVIILLCQIGFALVQSGASRLENAALPFRTNFLTFAISCLSVWSFGFTLAKSDGVSTIGYNQWFSYQFEPKSSTIWLVHLCVSMTTANIATHGGLERCPVVVYCLVTAIVSGLISGLVGRWTWYHSSWTALNSPFQGVAYKDIGGSGVIHVVGGSAAMVLSLVLRPRQARIRSRKSGMLYNDITGHSIPLEMLGWYLLLICIMCCNCLRITTTCVTCQTSYIYVSHIIINSAISASTSCVFSLALVHIVTTVLGSRRFHYLNSRLMTNGALIGLVAVAAGSDVYPHWASFVVGLTASISYILWSVFLYLSCVDDAVGVTAVHLGGGLWGVLCVHLFRDKTGLVFTDQPVHICLAAVWNVVTALILAVFTATITCLVLMIPKGLHFIPINECQEIGGTDEGLLGPLDYTRDSQVMSYTTDHGEDLEEVITSTSPLSPLSSTMMSPNSNTLTRSSHPDTDLPVSEEIKVPYQRLDVSLPSFTCSPGYLDRRVWFTEDSFPQQKAPASPKIDYDSEENYWNDVVF